MNILLLGSGGREHALAWKLAQSEHCDHLIIAPGNPGTAELGENVACNPANPWEVVKLAQEKRADWVVVGPEAPLVAGVADELRKYGFRVVGPGAAGAQLEGSKAFAKAFMERRNIPTPRYRSFQANQLQEALDYLAQHPLPVVVKASGLAAGKGVVVTGERAQAEAALRAMLSGERHGEAGAEVVIEQFLQGIEVSVFLLTDGRQYQLLPMAKDYKRLGEGDAGPNTGGMGAVSPVPFVDRELRHKIMFNIIQPTLEGLQAEGIPYQGFMFLGLMIVEENGERNPYVLEYNVRLGDPETQVILPRLQTDLMLLFEGLEKGDLRQRQVAIHPYDAATVVCVSEGYPGPYAKGRPITVEEHPGGQQLMFHAGTHLRQGHNGFGPQLVTNGGRVVAVTGFGPGLRDAIDNALEGVHRVNFVGKTFRNDIGHDLMRL